MSFARNASRTPRSEGETGVGLPDPAWELSLVGQNLLHDEHAEFGAPANRVAIGRSGYLEIAWRH